MPYTFQCDGPCNEQITHMPPFIGEFTEQFLKTRGGRFAEKFKPGQKVTICSNCMEDLVL